MVRISYRTALEDRRDAAGKCMLARVREARRCANEDYYQRSLSWWLAYLSATWWRKGNLFREMR
jgi:hypothetical protein